MDIWGRAMTIKETLGALSDKERRLLMYAFEHSLGQHVTLPGNRFIGVNVEHIKSLEVEDVAGAWAIGRVKG